MTSTKFSALIIMAFGEAFSSVERMISSPKLVLIWATICSKFMLLWLSFPTTFQWLLAQQWFPVLFFLEA